MKTRHKPFRVCGMNTPPLRSRPGCEGEVGGVEMVLLDALAPGGRLASFSDSLEISPIRPPNGYRVVDPVAGAVGKDRAVDTLTAPVSGRSPAVGSTAGRRPAASACRRRPARGRSAVALCASLRAAGSIGGACWNEPATSGLQSGLGKWSEARNTCKWGYSLRSGWVAPCHALSVVSDHNPTTSSVPPSNTPRSLA
jgi:hypothetical protein